MTGYSNIESGGTTTVGTTVFSGGTTGSVLFVGAASVVQQDNANLFWDDTNNRLGIGTATPSTPLNVFGSVTTLDLSTFQVASTQTTLGTDKGLLNLYNTDTTTNTYTSIVFSSNDAGATQRNGASINAIFTAHAASTITSQLVFRAGVSNAIGTVVNMGQSTIALQALSLAVGSKCIVAKCFTSQTANNYEAWNSSNISYFYVGPDILSGSSTTSNWLGISATMPTTMSAATYGVNMQITGAGSSSFANALANFDYLAGYTGSSQTIGVACTNRQAGTGNTLFTAIGNLGFSGSSIGTTTGTNVGGWAQASNGDISIGLWGQSITTKNSGKNIGVVGMGINGGTSPTEIGGYFGLQSSVPTFASAALMCDNGTEAADIFVARDNGTAYFKVVDGGNVSMIRGQIVHRTTVADASYAVLTTDYIIEYTSLTTGRTVTLPTAVGATGQVYIIKDGTGSALSKNITIATTSSQTIDGVTTRVMNTNYQAVSLYSDGANWKVF